MKTILFPYKFSPKFFKAVMSALPISSITSLYKLVSLLALGLVLFSGCAVVSYDPNKDYSFMDESSSISLPSKGKSRIYAFRVDTFVGSAIRHNVLLHTLAQANDGFKDGFFFGYSRPGNAFYVDITPIGEPIYISGKTEARSTFHFTPQADKIYCIEMRLGVGFFVARPDFILVDKERCEQFVPQYISEDSMQRWQVDKQKYLEKLQGSKQ